MFTGKRMMNSSLYTVQITPVILAVTPSLNVAKQVEPLSLSEWHERLGHQSKYHVESWLKQNEITFIKDDAVCESCILGKHHRQKFGERVKAGVPGEIVHTDLCGPMSVSTHGGHNYFMAVTDEFSKFRSVYLLKQKSEVPRMICDFLGKAKASGHPVKNNNVRQW